METLDPDTDHVAKNWENLRIPSTLATAVHPLCKEGEHILDSSQQPALSGAGWGL